MGDTVEANQLDLNELFSLEDLAARHPRILSVTILRYQLRNRDINGLARAVVPIGKKLFISESRYQQWLSETANTQAAS